MDTTTAYYKAMMDVMTALAHGRRVLLFPETRGRVLPFLKELDWEMDQNKVVLMIGKNHDSYRLYHNEASLRVVTHEENLMGETYHLIVIDPRRSHRDREMCKARLSFDKDSKMLELWF